MRHLKTKFHLLLAGLAVAPTLAFGQAKHGIAMYGEPALPADFKALPYANPDAPKGGVFVQGEAGVGAEGFDAMNPYILKGRSPYGLRVYVFESLLGRSWDESFSLYGLLAESVEAGPEREWVEFHLRPEARFSDGTAVTIDDVIWSYETLAEKGLPRYKTAWSKVETYEKVGERGIRFNFNSPDNELPLLLGLRPILNPRDWADRPFEEPTLDVPTGSGPYVVGDFEAGRFIEFDRNPDYWGRDLAYNQGLYNFDTLRYEFYGDQGIIFEAFKAGEVSMFRETNPDKWENDYDFAAVTDGKIMQSVVPHQRPSGMKGFVFNTRRDKFQDWRVRDALIHTFNFEFVNKTLNGGIYPRRSSYFANSHLAMSDTAAEGQVRELLEPFADELLPGALEGYSLPSSDGSDRNRANMRAARDQMAAAGWTVQDGALKNEAGEVFGFSIMLNSASDEAIANLWIDALSRLGIAVTIETVDNAQHKARKAEYDYDVFVNSWPLSLSPGNEQQLYWGAAGVETPGTRNYMGMNSPAAEAMIDTLLTADDQDEFVAATKALDRILTSGRYVVPFWYSDVSLIAHSSDITYPKDTLPAYGDWIGFMPDVWWSGGR